MATRDEILGALVGRYAAASRAAIAKNTASGGGRSAAERELALQKLVSRAVVSTEIIDIVKAAGIESTDISILSDDFLAEVRPACGSALKTTAPRCDNDA